MHPHLPQIQPRIDLLVQAVDTPPCVFRVCQSARRWRERRGRPGRGGREVDGGGGGAAAAAAGEGRGWRCGSGACGGRWAWWWRGRTRVGPEGGGVGGGL